MRYKVTVRTHELVRGIRQLMAQIGPSVSLVSPEARAEWVALPASLPSDLDLQRGWIVISEDDLEAVEGRVRRFGEIVRRLRAAAAVMITAANRSPRGDVVVEVRTIAAPRS